LRAAAGPRPPLHSTFSGKPVDACSGGVGSARSSITNTADGRGPDDPSNSESRQCSDGRPMVGITTA